MKIGLFTDTYFPQVSGVATSVKTLADQLRAQGHEVYIFTTTDPDISKKTSEPNIYRFSSIPYVGFKDRRVVYRGLWAAVKIAKKLELDIVHTQTEFSLGLIGKFVARQLKIPVVHTYHTMYQDYTHYVLNGRLINARGVEHLVNAYLKNVAGVIAPSERVWDTLINYGVAAPMAIIPTGVAQTHGRDNSAAVRRQLGIRVDQPVMLSLGRLAFEKNLDNLISIFSEVAMDNPNAVLVIVGDGPARQMLEEEVEEFDIADKVYFVGAVDHDDIYSYYRLANVFVSVSTSETQGLTFIETMSAQRPFVAVESKYLTDIVNDDSIGTLIEPNRISVAVSAIEKYLQRDPDEPSPAREHQISKIDAITFGESVEKFYQTILADYHFDDDSGEEPTDEELSYVRSLVRRLPFRRNKSND